MDSFQNKSLIACHASFRCAYGILVVSCHRPLRTPVATNGSAFNFGAPDSWAIALLCVYTERVHPGMGREEGMGSSEQIEGRMYGGQFPKQNRSELPIVSPRCTYDILVVSRHRPLRLPDATNGFGSAFTREAPATANNTMATRPWPGGTRGEGPRKTPSTP